MNVDHTRNLIILNDLDYVKEFYDFDSKTKSFGITENGMRALICWNRIHGLKDSLKITEKYTQPVTEDEMRNTCNFFLENKLVTILWNGDRQQSEYYPTLSGFELFDSLNFFIDKKLQKRIEQKQKVQKVFNSLMEGISKTSKGLASMQQPPPSKKQRRRR
jgi:hypothetical protein